jgi:hypothetical protein
MAKFCNKCGAPLGGIFCVKCGADSRLTVSPQPQPPLPQPVSAPSKPGALESVPVQSATPEISIQPSSSVPPAFPVAASANSPAAKFCNKCGAPSIGAPFCNKCGASIREAARPAPQPAAAEGPQRVPPPSFPPPSQPMPAAQSTTKGSPLTKILIGVAVVVITVGALAAGGVYYVVYRVKQKVHEVARDVPGLGSASDNISNTGGGVMGSISKMVSGSGNNDGGDSGSSGKNGRISGDPCRLLSKDEVGSAIGVQIVATESTDGGCSYLAQGDSADMTAKHMSAMMATKGADEKTQKIIQGFAGGMGKMFQSEGHDKGTDSNGNVPVFNFSVDNNSAETQMRLNAKVLGGLGPGQQGIPGIGDQAFDEAGAIMMVRKGDKLIRIMYSTCPCSLEAIKPLAKTLADRL